MIPVKSNSPSHIREFFRESLKEIYSQNETDSILREVFIYLTGTKNPERISESEINKLELIFNRLIKNEPIQYILNRTFFYKNEFYVDHNVLIPRPETEELVDLVLQENHKSDPVVIDFCTGSGCIAISINKELPDSKVIGVEKSEKAITVAKRNAISLGAIIEVIEDDVLNLKNTYPNVDIIISNPPYIKQSESSLIASQVIDFEPKMALFVDGNDDTIFYKKIIAFANEKLVKGGLLYFELNPITANSVKEYIESTFLYEVIDILKDMSGNNRFIRAKKRP
ncbi:MAG: peptide chain release factor N(5)-glutamine methyltransferase [Bacteroidia bacterium]